MNDDELMQAMAEEVKAFVAEATAPLLGKIADLEARIAAIPAGAVGPAGAPGAEGKPGPEGKSITADDVTPLLTALVTAAVDALPPAQVGPQGAEGKPGAEGKSITAEDVEPLLDGLVRSAVAALPPAAAGPQGLPGEPGAKGADAVINEPMIAELVTRTVNERVALIPAPTPGRDGQPGVPGAPGKDGDKGTAGLPGKDGIDGLEQVEFSVALKDDNRTLEFALSRGEIVKTHAVTAPWPLDVGTYKMEREYAPGDGVTDNGCFWIAQEKTTDRPGTSAAWRMAVKKGRDGKDLMAVPNRGADTVRLR